MPQSTIPTSVEDPINQRILAVSEDRIQGFHRDPISEIAARTELNVDTVLERIRGMLEAGTIRRVRQTLMSTNLAPGALVAWKVPAEKLNDAFDWMFASDPFTGHVVIRSTDAGTAGSEYRLWTTVKVPSAYSMEKHLAYLGEQVGAEGCKPLPAKKVFALGVGHIRRRGIKPGARSDQPGRMLDVNVVDLTDEEWRVLIAMKRDFTPEELGVDLWAKRADEAGVSTERLCEIAESLDERRVIGRFSTFLEHVKKLGDGKTVTRYNALFHWAVAPGQEIDAGKEVGRHLCMTHAYWRDGGEEFKHVNIMGVAHGQEKETVLENKAAIDQHLMEAGFDLRYTNVFWGGRSEIKPSEISPPAYITWCESRGIDPASMKA